MFFITDEKIESMDVICKKIDAECQFIQFTPNKFTSKKTEQTAKIEFKPSAQEYKKKEKPYSI